MAFSINGANIFRSNNTNTTAPLKHFQTANTKSIGDLLKSGRSGSVNSGMRAVLPAAGNVSPESFVISNAEIAAIPIEGNAAAGQVISDALEKMLSDPESKIEFTSDEWSALANKPDKTPDDIQKLDAEYNENIQKIGNSMTKYISKTFAKGGDIDLEAFMKFQSGGEMNLSGITLQQQTLLKNSFETAFNRIDFKKDGKIDEKEMSAFMHALDFDENNRLNSKITAENYISAASQLDDPNQNLLDTKIEYCYNKLYGGEEQ